MMRKALALLVLFSLFGAMSCGSGTGNSVTIPTAPPIPTAPVYSGPLVYFGIGLNTQAAVAEYAPITTTTPIPVKGFFASRTFESAKEEYVDIAVDASRNVFALAAPEYPDGITPIRLMVFPPTADGITAPARTITGLHTGLVSSGPIKLDTAGNIYVLQPNQAILEFSPSANGDDAPIRTFSSANIPDSAFRAIDSKGYFYLVSDERVPNSTNIRHSIGIFAPSATGDLIPVRKIAGPHTGIDGNGDGKTYQSIVAVRLDATDNLYILIGNNAYPPVPGQAILEFAAGADGDVTPIRTIVGNHTEMTQQEVTGMCLDASGNMYVNYFNYARGKGALVKFDAAATGDATPVATVHPDPFYSFPSGGPMACH